MIAEKASEKGLQLDFDIDPGIQCNLHGDPRRLSQVLINYAAMPSSLLRQATSPSEPKKIEENENSILVHFEVQIPVSA